TGLALAAHKRGHEVYYIGVGDFTYTADGQMGAHARKAPETKFRNSGTFLTELQETPQTTLTAADLDVLMLRNDPAEEIEKRPLAQSMGVIVGQLAHKQGVIVLNVPGTLNEAINKVYCQHYPEEVRPGTVITRNVDGIDAFFKESKGKMVLKPLQGSGGRN